MLNVSEVRVLPFHIEYNEIVWQIDNTAEDVFDYDFYVLRSEAEAGPYSTIAGPLVDKYYVRDASILSISQHRLYYYKVLVRNRVNGQQKEWGPFDIEGIPNLLAKEIINNESAVLWTEHAGTCFWVFPRRTFGQRCPDCWNEALEKTTNPRCRTCWHTGFSGGYHYPIQFWGQYDQAIQKEQNSTEDHRQTKHSLLRCGPSPGIKPLDLIIDYKNIRYRVMDVGGSSLNGACVRQDVQLVKLENGSVEWNIPLKIPKDTKLVPERNFTNPQSPDTIKLNCLEKYGL